MLYNAVFVSTGKWIVSRKLLDSTGSSAQCFRDLQILNKIINSLIYRFKGLPIDSAVKNPPAMLQEA